MECATQSTGRKSLTVSILLVVFRRVSQILLEAKSLTPRIPVTDQWGRSDYLDSDKVVRAFVESCLLAGFPRCSLAPESAPSAEAIYAKIDGLIQRTYEKPMKVVQSDVPGLLTSRMVRGFIFSALYRPRGWGAFADAMQQAHMGNGSTIYEAERVKVELDSSKEASTAFANPGPCCHREQCR